MFDAIKRLFGRGKPQEPTPEELAAMEAFADAKQAALDAALGPMNDNVLHAFIPFVVGGALDLYIYEQHIPGTLYVTQELLEINRKGRPKPSKLGPFELVAAYRPDDAPPPEGKLAPSVQLAMSILNPTARYAFAASLNPGNTAEIPGDEGEPNTCLVFDRYDLRGKSLSIQGEEFFLLLVIQVHPSELAFARTSGTDKLLALLKQKNYYPYSDLVRPAVA